MITITFLGYTVCLVAALTGGFIDAIAGGGGLLTMPALLLAGVPPHMALGTNKIGACLGTTVALINFSANHLVRWRMVAGGLGFSILGSWLGSVLALHMDSALLGKIIIALLPVGMIATLIPPRKEASTEMREAGFKFWSLLAAVCLGIGLYDGFFGPATGSFLILALYWVLKLDLIHASATAKAFNLGSNASAAVAFAWNGAVAWKLAVLMAACLMLGNWIGSRMAIRVGSKVVRRFLVVSLLLLMVSLILRYFQ